VLIAAFKWLCKQLIVISAILAVCYLLVLVVQGESAAVALISTAVVGMKGPWVWTFGFGLASFIADRGRLLPAVLDGILVPNEATLSAMARIERATHHRNALKYTVPITVLGAFLTTVYGVPNKGIGHVMIFLGICSIYYIAAFLLFHFIEITLAFNQLFEAMDAVEFKRIYSPLHLENLTTYLALTTGLGLIAIYAGFRGTLTAGFEFSHETWRMFLSTPLILFLPGTLFYNYYPRYVLRKILQHKVFRTMERLGAVEDQNTKALLLDLKETAVLNSQILPFLDYKSLPSYLIAVFFAISVACSNDPAIKTFLNYVLNLGSKSASP
jgi:hypothetical protein